MLSYFVLSIIYRSALYYVIFLKPLCSTVGKFFLSFVFALLVTFLHNPLKQIWKIKFLLYFFHKIDPTAIKHFI